MLILLQQNVLNSPQKCEWIQIHPFYLTPEPWVFALVCVPPDIVDLEIVLTIVLRWVLLDLLSACIMAAIGLPR